MTNINEIMKMRFKNVVNKEGKKALSYNATGKVLSSIEAVPCVAQFQPTSLVRSTLKLSLYTSVYFYGASETDDFIISRKSCA